MMLLELLPVSVTEKLIYSHPSVCVTPTFKSPDMLAPARIPVAAGKKMAKTEKKPSPSLKSGPKFS